MKTINLREFGPVISDKEIGKSIYQMIKDITDKDEKVEVDLADIRSMATYCAKQIFGNLYVQLGAAVFYEKVLLKNANNDLKTIVNIGIQHALSEIKKS